VNAALEKKIPPRWLFAFGSTSKKLFSRQPVVDGSSFSQYLIAAAVVIAVTLAAFLFEPFVGIHSTAFIFLLVVVVMALFVGRGPTLLAATMSALLWDYYFLPPIYAFRITHLEDGILLGMYFGVSLVLGQLTARIRAQEKTERQREEHSTALYLLTRELTEATDPDQMLEKAVIQMERAFKAKIAVLVPDWTKRLKQYPHPASTLRINDQDREVAAWVFENGKSAGKFTDNLPLTGAFYLPLATSSETLGVIGLQFSQTFAPTIHQRNLLDAFVRQIALALDRHRLQEVSEKSKLLTESERLSKTLLNSISHEIRTPISAIKSATSNLIEFREAPLSESQQAMIAEIQEATERLNRLVGNVLEITRIESGRVKPKLNLYDVRDLIQVTLKETKKELAQHKVTLNVAADLPLVQMDFVLTQQALTNLLSNAAFHTPPGTAVQVNAAVEDHVLVLTVADRGPGIPPESIARIFDKFYRDPTAPAGGMGLGLSLVRGLVIAQGGRIQVENRPEGGAAFTICLPLNKISPN